MQNRYEEYRCEEEKRRHQNQSDDQKIESVPWRIFSARIDRSRRDDRFRGRLYLQFGKRLIW